MTAADADPRSAPLSPAVIGAALDCLATMPSANPLEPSTMIAIGRAIGCTHDEAAALTVRVRAAALILEDTCQTALNIAPSSACKVAPTLA